MAEALAPCTVPVRTLQESAELAGPAPPRAPLPFLKIISC